MSDEREILDSNIRLRLRLRLVYWIINKNNIDVFHTMKKILDPTCIQTLLSLDKIPLQSYQVTILEKAN